MLRIVDSPDTFLSERPNLGCAMILAACRAHGIEARLVRGHTRFLKNMLLEDCAEYLDLPAAISDRELEKKGLAGIKTAVAETGMERFQSEARRIYTSFFVDRNPRDYMNNAEIGKLNRFCGIFKAIATVFIEKNNAGALPVIRRLTDEILSENPGYLAFSLSSFGPVSRAIRQTVRQLSDIPIIIGGPFTPFLPQDRLESLFDREVFDYLVVGPGDLALPRLIDVLENKKEPVGIPNVFYTRNGRLKANKLRAVENPDELPLPDFTQFDINQYFSPVTVLPVQSARGCSWQKCAFCNYHQNAFGTYRTFGVEKTVDTIAFLQKTHNCDYFHFHDDDFPPDRARQICEEIRNRNLSGLHFHQYCRFDKGFDDPALAVLMREAGFSAMYWGLESGCQRVLNRMKKGVKVGDAGAILKLFSRNDIINVCMAFFGFPGETLEDAEESLAFMRAHSEYIDFLELQVFQLDPLFSRIAQHPEKWGVVIDADGGYSTRSGMTREEATAFHKKVLAKINMNAINVMNDALQFLKGPETRFPPSIFAFLRKSAVSGPDAMARIQSHEDTGIWPIIVGDVNNENGKIAFRPININETPYVNTVLSRKTLILDEITETITNLSDGRRSVSQIIDTLGEKFEEKYEKAELRDRCIEFLAGMFSNNRAIAIDTPWPMKNHR